MLPRAALAFQGPSCRVPSAQPLHHIASPRQHSLAGIPPFLSLCPSCLLSRDQVLRVMAKNEEQLSLLRGLEGLKPQKVRTPQGLGTCWTPRSQWHAPLAPSPPAPTPNLPSRCLCQRRELCGEIKCDSSSGKARNTCPEGCTTLLAFPSGLGEGCSEKQPASPEATRRAQLSLGGMPCSMQTGHICFPIEVA